MTADEVALLSAGAAIASALTGLVSVAFSERVHNETRKLLSPFERPVLSLMDPNAVLAENGYGLLIKNTGQRAATNIRFRMRAASEVGSDQGLVFPPVWAPANDYQPSAEMVLMLAPVTFERDTVVQVEAFYADALSGRVFERESYWLRIFPKESKPVRGMDRDTREKLERTWGTQWTPAARDEREVSNAKS